jgi:UDP-N-acetylglucosamine 4,6-dehydratase
MLIANLNRKTKHTLMILADVFLVPFSLWVAFSLRLSDWSWPSPNQEFFFLLAPVLAVPIFFKFGMYREVVRFIGQRGMVAIFQATGVVVLLWFVLVTADFIIFHDVEIKFPLYLGTEMAFPRSIPVIFWMALLLTVGGSRQIVRWILMEPVSNYSTKPKRNIVIYGAGMGGVHLASSLAQNSRVNVLGFIDDDISLQGHVIQNLEVLGDRSEIENVRRKFSPLEVLLAIPKLHRLQRKELLKALEYKKVTVRTVPSLDEMASGKGSLNELREIDISDLLGRLEVESSQKLLTACVSDKMVMVTGAGGSIGSELCRQIILLNPSCIVLLDHAEHSLYLINLELSNLKEKYNLHINIIPVLGSVTSSDLVEETIQKYKIDTIYHAAAYKHVALLESNISEAVINNVFGTYNVASAALKLNVESFILISTDKAVRPTSAMGATKRVAELIIQGIFKKQEAELKKDRRLTRFVIVRFGNVLGSSGSVIPLFQKQIASGGPITITHPDATRYFMTIYEASQLVIQAGAIGSDSSVFVLNMGEPVSILKLAKQMVYLSGHSLKNDDAKTDSSCVDIQITGLQKGEKIHEELFIGQNISSTEHPMILKAKEEFVSWQEVESMLVELKSKLKADNLEMRQLLIKCAMKNNNDKSVQS